LHRDIKPANVLLTAEGSPCLADFNVGTCTKLEGAGPASLFGGSLAYMSPEQLEAFDPGHGRDPATVDGRSDLYSLGVTLWEMLAGERPFGSEALAGDWAKTLSTLTERRKAGVPPAADAGLPADRPDGLAEVLRAGLDPDPARRFATAGEMAVALELCRHPQLTPPAHGWRAWVRRHPVLALLPLGALPNVLASLFNIYYNQGAIIDPWGEPERGGAPDAFPPLISAINGIFFPLCLALFVWGVWPVVRALRTRRAEDGLPPAEAGPARRRCLLAGQIAAYVCVAGWAVAGVLWPISLDVAAVQLGGKMLQPADHVHLLFSLILCGLFAAAYPFFLVTFLAVRVLYPALLLTGPPDAEDGPALGRLEGTLGRFLVVAAAVPLGSIAVLMVFREQTDRLALGLFSGAGLAGFALAYALERRIRADLASLAHIVAPDAAPEAAPTRH
jgi:eukaryotic-like serine/threonine-protein kinase